MTATLIVDLSEYQQKVDFSKLKGQVAGVILRVQAGSTHADTRYKEYVEGCKANGIMFGTYAYFKGLDVADAIQEAKDAFARMDKASLFFVVDIEVQTCKNRADLIPAGQAYIDYLKSQGVKHVGLYSGEYFYVPYGLKAIKADFIWMAKYGANDGQPHTAPVVPWDLWQYSDNGKVAGVSTRVDLTQVNPSGKGLNFFFPQPAPPKPVEVPAVHTVEPKPSVNSIPVVKPVAQDTHKVVSGDTLSELATKYHTTVANLKSLNGLTSDVIRIGDILKVSGTVSPK